MPLTINNWTWPHPVRAIYRKQRRSATKLGPSVQRAKDYQAGR